MNIKIFANDMYLAPEDRDLIERRMETVFASRRSSIDCVEVWLCEIPGFEAEAMKHCRIEIKLVNGCMMIGDSSEFDLEIVLQRAALRASRNLISASAWLTLSNHPLASRDRGNDDERGGHFDSAA